MCYPSIKWPLSTRAVCPSDPGAVRRRRQDEALNAASKSLKLSNFDKSRLAIRLEERQTDQVAAAAAAAPSPSKRSGGRRNSPVRSGGRRSGESSVSGTPQRSQSVTPMTAHSTESEWNYKWDNYQSLHEFDNEIRAASPDR